MSDDPIGDALSAAKERAKTTPSAADRNFWKADHETKGAVSCATALESVFEKGKLSWKKSTKRIHPTIEKASGAHTAFVSDNRVKVEIEGEGIQIKFNGHVECPPSQFPAEEPQLTTTIECAVITSKKSTFNVEGAFRGYLNGMPQYVINEGKLINRIASCVTVGA